MQIDPNVDSLLQSPSQPEALHERDQLAELEIAAAAKPEAMRETGVVLPFGATAASGDALEDSLSSEQPLEYEP